MAHCACQNFGVQLPLHGSHSSNSRGKSTWSTDCLTFAILRPSEGQLLSESQSDLDACDAAGRSVLTLAALNGRFGDRPRNWNLLAQGHRDILYVAEVYHCLGPDVWTAVATKILGWLGILGMFLSLSNVEVLCSKGKDVGLGSTWAKLSQLGPYFEFI